MCAKKSISDGRKTSKKFYKELHFLQENDGQTKKGAIQNNKMKHTMSRGNNMDKINNKEIKLTQ